MKLQKGSSGGQNFIISLDENDQKEKVSMWWYNVLYKQISARKGRHAIETYKKNLTNGVLVSFEYED